MSQYQKGKTNLDFAEARDSEWQWHQLGHMQVCTSLQTDNHASTPPLSFYRPDALPAAQLTASKHFGVEHDNNNTGDGGMDGTYGAVACRCVLRWVDRRQRQQQLAMCSKWKTSPW